METKWIRGRWNFDQIEPPLDQCLEPVESPAIRCPNCRAIWTCAPVAHSLVCGCDMDAPAEERTVTPSDFQRGFYFGLIAAQELLGLHNMKLTL